MEASAVILAIIPLVIEGFKASSKAVEALSTFKRYSSVVTSLKVRVKTHETILRNSSEHLESTLERYQELGTPDRGQLSDKQLRAENLLNQSLDVCGNCLHEIKNLLDTIVKVLERFRLVGHLSYLRHAYSPLVTLNVFFSLQIL